MKAITYCRYGGFDVLRLRDIARPTLKDDEVLVRVHAAGLHIGDCFTVRGAPWVVRTRTGLLRPKYGVPGFDLAGRIEAVGKRVWQFQPGEDVFGVGVGTCAEFARAPARQLVPKPAALSFEQAAAVPTSALAALHALRDTANVGAGQHVLIKGASGGVGTYAIQLGVHLGARVTGVCGPANAELVSSLGASQVIDYTREDFTLRDEKFDVILDNVENCALGQCRRVLMPSGTLVLNSGTGATGLAFARRLLAPLLLSPFTRQNLRRFISKPDAPDLELLSHLIDMGAVRPVVSKTYAIEDTAAALTEIEQGHVSGKVVIAIEPSS
jgi:NADPH:quinone reductase-like Zn-dependent oxidoreductase